MQSVVYKQPHFFDVMTVPDPHPGPGEVRLRVVVAGVCGTDGHLHDGHFGPSYPLTPGHEVVGEIDEVGPGVADLRLGQLVALDNTSTCGTCTECRRAMSNFCSRLVAQGVNAPGGFAEHIVALAGKCYPVDDLDPEVAVLAEPVACVMHGLDVLALRPGSSVLVLGAGPTGLLLAQLLRHAGAHRVVVAAPTEAKLELARRYGADQTVLMDRARPEETAAELARVASDGFDAVVEATGALTVLEQCLPLTRTGGTVFVYGMTHESDRWAVPPYAVFRRQLTIKGSFAQAHSFDRALQALRTGRVQTEGIITHRFPLERYADALASLQDRSCVKAVVEP